MSTERLPRPRFDLDARPTLPVGPPRTRRKPLPDANPIAAHVLGQLTTRFRAAAERALAAESQQGRAVAFLDALGRFLEHGAPAPAAFRSALAVQTQTVEVTR